MEVFGHRDVATDQKINKRIHFELARINLEETSGSDISVEEDSFSDGEEQVSTDSDDEFIREGSKSSRLGKGRTVVDEGSVVFGWGGGVMLLMLIRERGGRREGAVSQVGGL